MDTECFLGDGYKALLVYSVKIYIELHFSITLLLFAQMGGKSSLTQVTSKKYQLETDTSALLEKRFHM